MKYSKEALIELSKFTANDLEMIRARRRNPNRLGFAYQLAFVRLHNRFPIQQPLEIEPDILNYVGIQLKLSPKFIKAYAHRQKTVSEHREQIRQYLNVQRFSEISLGPVEKFIFEKACQLEQTHALLSLVRNFLRQQNILQPAESTLRRLIDQQRQKARELIVEKIHTLLSDKNKQQLNQLLQSESKPYSGLQYLKQTTGRASANTIIKITQKLDKIKSTGIVGIDLSWLNNNLQRSMTRFVRKATAFRMREFHEKKRHALLVCFLQQHNQDLTDDLV